jgi:hypothetical protein
MKKRLFNREILEIREPRMRSGEQRWGLVHPTAFCPWIYLRVSSFSRICWWTEQAGRGILLAWRENFVGNRPLTA